MKGPLRGLFIGILIALAIPTTRNGLLSLSAPVLGVAAGVFLAVLVYAAVTVKR